MLFLEVFADGQRLGKQGAVVFECGHLAERIDGFVGGLARLTLAEIYRSVLERDPFEIGGDTHPETRRGPTVVVELHRSNSWRMNESIDTTDASVAANVTARFLNSLCGCEARTSA